jgi:hypothetical protein
MHSFALRKEAHSHSHSWPSPECSVSPENSDDEDVDDESVRYHAQHHTIHSGLAKLSLLVAKWSDDPKSYSPTEMKECLESFREELFMDLDEEVANLGADNMKRYWTLEEMDRFPM